MQKKSLIYKEFINTLTSYYSIMLNISKNKKTKKQKTKNKKQKTKNKNKQKYT